MVDNLEQTTSPPTDDQPIKEPSEDSQTRQVQPAPPPTPKMEDKEEQLVRPVISPEAFDFADRIRSRIGEHLVRMVIRALCELVPDVLPNINTWDETAQGVVPDILSRLEDKTFIAVMHPTLKRIMGANIGNEEWASKVIIGLTLYHVLWEGINGSDS